jgi:hypothetical protein
MPHNEAAADERASSLERFLRSPFGVDVTPGEIEFLRGHVLPALPPEYGIQDYVWGMFLQGYRVATSGHRADEPPQS